MFLFHGVRFWPSVPTPASQWLDMPVVSTTPVVDDAGITYAQDLVLTEGFYTLVGVYVLWRIVLRLVLFPRRHD